MNDYKISLNFHALYQKKTKFLSNNNMSYHILELGTIIFFENFIFRDCIIDISSIELFTRPSCNNKDKFNDAFFKYFWTI